MGSDIFQAERSWRPRPPLYYVNRQGNVEVYVDNFSRGYVRQETGTAIKATEDVRLTLKAVGALKVHDRRPTT